MNTPLPQFPQESFIEPAPRAGASVVSQPDPDDPPWGVPAAVALWLASFLLLAFVPLFAVFGYILYRRLPLNEETLRQTITSDPHGILASIAAVIPTHLLTIALAWALVTGFGRRPFWRSLGWRFGERFGFWTSAGLAVLLLVMGGLILRAVGGEATEIDQIITSSTAARFTTAFLATATAPLVEELIYRGVLYSALRRSMVRLWEGVAGGAVAAADVGLPRALGTVSAVVGVSALFALVHTWQYRNNLGVIATITILSFALTTVRAATGRLLPCFVIHTVFNGIQSAYLVLQHFRPDLFDAAKPGLICAPALARALGLHV